MDNQSLLRNLNTYTHAANRDMIRHLINEQSSNPRAALLMSHIVNAQEIWYARIMGERSAVKVFEPRAPEVLLDQNDIIHKHIEALIVSAKTQESIEYINTKRQRFRNTVSEILLHVFNHATYHRGQINQLLVQEGKQAIPVDLIGYVREEIL